jgi:hypothetical protein
VNPYPWPMHGSQPPALDAHPSRHHLFGAMHLSPTRTPRQTMGEHLHILSTAPQPREGTHTPQRGHAISQ